MNIKEMCEMFNRRRKWVESPQYIRMQKRLEENLMRFYDEMEKFIHEKGDNLTEEEFYVIKGKLEKKYDLERNEK